MKFGDSAKHPDQFVASAALKLQLERGKAVFTKNQGTKAIFLIFKGHKAMLNNLKGHQGNFCKC